MRLSTIALILAMTAGCSSPPASAPVRPVTPPSQAVTGDSDAADPDSVVAARIRGDADLAAVLTRARDLVTKGGLNAGGGYPQVWIRDYATFLPLYLASGGDTSAAKHALLTFLAFQGADGGIPDGYAATSLKLPDSTPSALAPGLSSFKNTVETDQESSLVQAVASYVRSTGDTSILRMKVGGREALARLEDSMLFLLRHRTDVRTGLLWSGTTVDWGDVEAGTDHVTALGADSHPAIGIYTNAMFTLALRDLASLPGADGQRWSRVRVKVDHAVRQWLWDAANGKYRAHLYLHGSPFPKDFDESRVVVHGGTAVAILAGLLTPGEARRALALADADVAAAHADSIGLTVWPPYPQRSFATTSGPYAMGPYQYQNAGDWDWFGARWVQALIAVGAVSEAYREFQPMLRRIQRAGDFYEWWDRQGQPHGSAGFRGAAGVDGIAIIQLLDWARKH